MLRKLIIKGNELLNVFHFYAFFNEILSILGLQQIHKRNRGSDATFCLSEIEIPSIYNGPPSAPRSVLGDLIRALDTVCPVKCKNYKIIHYGS